MVVVCLFGVSVFVLNLTGEFSLVPLRLLVRLLSCLMGVLGCWIVVGSLSSFWSFGKRFFEWLSPLSSISRVFFSFFLVLGGCVGCVFVWCCFRFVPRCSCPFSGNFSIFSLFASILGIAKNVLVVCLCLCLCLYTQCS